MLGVCFCPTSMESEMNSRTYWLAVRHPCVLAAWKAMGIDLSARFRFARIPKTVSENWMVPR